MAKETRVHPLFKQITDGTEYDIALIKLSSKAPNSYKAAILNSYEVEMGNQTMRYSVLEEIARIKSFLCLRSVLEQFLYLPKNQGI